jgi:hypothetical protein
MKETKFASTEITKVSDTQIEVSYKRTVEEIVSNTVSILELRNQKSSLLKAINDTEESKAQRIAEADNSIAALQAQITHIDFLITEGLKTGVADEE